MIALRSPLHALLWKEWRSLRPLRWAGLVLGALLPLCFVAGAELGRQGMSPLGSVTTYTVTTILRDAVPAAFACGLWPLAALLFIAHGLGGDRASGTETFLLERPVGRRLTWMVRILISLASVAVVVAVTGGIWAVWYRLAGADGSGWMGPLRMFALGGAIVLLATICGTISSSLITPPLLAVLGSAAFVALPALLSAGLGAGFPHLRVGGQPVGFFVPWLLVFFYVGSSYAASCTGEPAGRGRLARGLGTLGIGVLATLFAYASTAQGVWHWESVHPDIHAELVPSPAGDRALLSHPFGIGGVWLVDTRTGRVLEHYGAPCYGATWRGDGGMFAILTSSGPLGSEGRTRISFFDRDGVPSATPWYAPSEAWVPLRLVWDGNRVVFAAIGPNNSSSRLVFVEPGKGEIASVPMPFGFSGWDYVGTLWDGSPAIAKLMPGEKENLDPHPVDEPVKRAYGLYRVSLASASIEPAPLVQENGYLHRPRPLSPSGRWWRRSRGRSEPQEMIDLETGRAVPATQGGWPDDPVRFFLRKDGETTTLVEERESGTARTLRSWSNAEVDLRRSPGNRYLLVRAISRHAPGEPYRPEMTGRSLWDSASGDWKPLPMPRELAASHPDHVTIVDNGSGSPTDLIEEEGKDLGDISVMWVGPSTLAWTVPHAMAFQDLDAPGPLRFVAGVR